MVAIHYLDALTDTQREAVARLSVAFARLGAALFLVGGSVRDLLLKRPSHDLDFATDAPPDLIRRAADQAGAHAIYSANERFATVGMIVAGLTLEITSFRGNGVADDGTVLDGLHADLGLRDFTINAMALELRGHATARLIDPFGGQADLHQRTIRGVVNPGARIAEDPLRALRAVRFAAELDYIVEPVTEAAITAQAAALARVSPERIGAELGRLLVAPQVVTGLHQFERLGLLREVLPELVPLVEFTEAGSKLLWPHTRKVVGRTPPRLITRWAALLHDSAKPRTYSIQGNEVHFFGHEAAGARIARKVLRRLKLERELIDGVCAVIGLHGRPAQYDTDWTDGGVRRLMLEIGPWLDDLLDLARADVTSGRAQVQQRARERIDALTAHCQRILAEEELGQLQSPLDGRQLMALFARSPGPWIKPLKDHLRDLVIDGKLAPDDIASATAEARRWMQEHSAA